MKMNLNVVNFFRVKIVDPQVESEVCQKFSEVLDDSDIKFLAVDDFDGSDVMYAFFSNQKAKKIKNIFSSYGVLVEHSDITQEILKNDQKSGEFQKVFSKDSNLTLLRNFREKNLTVDLILDKISESGVDSLTDLDKEILGKG